MASPDAGVPDLVISDDCLAVGRPIPTILVTGSFDDNAAVDALKCGMQLLRKPIGISLLMEAVQAMLARRVAV